jgi:hypothetical protein
MYARASSLNHNNMHDKACVLVYETHMAMSVLRYTLTLIYTIVKI